MKQSLRKYYYHHRRVVGAAIPPPDAPTNLTAVATGNDMALTWTDNSDDETGFELWRSLTGTGNPDSHPAEWTLVSDAIAANATSYDDLNL